MKNANKSPVGNGAFVFFAVNDGLNHIQPGFSLRRRIEAVQLRELFPTEGDIERCGILHHMLNTGRFRDRQHSRMTNHRASSSCATVIPAR